MEEKLKSALINALNSKISELQERRERASVVSKNLEKPISYFIDGYEGKSEDELKEIIDLLKGMSDKQLKLALDVVKAIEASE